MLSEGGFEDAYNAEINLLRYEEGVSFNSALDNLYSEYKRVKGDETLFDTLLKDWELRK